MELLDRKRQLLRRDHERAVERRQGSGEEWRQAITEAQRWALRAACLGGPTQLELLGARHGGRARVVVSWSNTMGVRHPDEVVCSLPELDPAEQAGGNAGMAPAAAAHRRALQAAAEHAADVRAADALEAELRATDHRLRAIEHRRLPALEHALRALEVRLDELEREERVISRWAHARTVGQVASASTTRGSRGVSDTSQ